jgi:hypothetical protein
MKMNNKSNKLKNLLCCKKSLYILVGIISLVVVFSTIQTSTIGAKLQYLEDKENKLDSETRLLEEELSKADSLIKISENAGTYSFAKPQKIVYSQGVTEVGMNLR